MSLPFIFLMKNSLHLAFVIAILFPVGLHAGRGGGIVEKPYSTTREAGGNFDPVMTKVSLAGLNSSTYYPGKLIGIPSNYSVVNCNLVSFNSSDGFTSSFERVIISYSDHPTSTLILTTYGGNSKFVYSMSTILLPLKNSNHVAYYIGVESDIHIQNLSRQILTSYDYIEELQFHGEMNLESYLAAYLTEISYLKDLSLQSKSHAYTDCFDIARQLGCAQKCFVASNLSLYNNRIIGNAYAAINFTQLDYTYSEKSAHSAASAWAYLGNPPQPYPLASSCILGDFYSIVCFAQSQHVQYQFSGCGNGLGAQPLAFYVCMPIKITCAMWIKTGGLGSASITYKNNDHGIMICIFGDAVGVIGVSTEYYNPSSSSVQVGVAAAAYSGYSSRLVCLPTDTAFG